MNDHWSRRHFLKGAGGFALALPLLPSLLPSRVSAASAAQSVTKRFVAIWSPYGVYMNNYWPTFEAKNVLAQDIVSHPLDQIPGGPSPVISTARFSSLFPKLNLIRGLDCTVLPGHNFNVMLGAGMHSATEVTIDNVLAQSSKIYPLEPVARSLHLRPSWNDKRGGELGVSFARIGKNISMVPNYWSAQGAFNRVFSGATDTSGKREKVVDKVYESYLRLKNHPRLSSEDKSRVDNHLTRLSELEQRFVAEKQLACRAPALQSESPDAGWDTIDWEKTMKNHIDVMVAALACGATRIGTLMFSGYTPFFDAGYHHATLAHNPDETSLTLKAQNLQINDWWAKWVAYLMSQMDGVSEANGKTLLDNSLVYWGYENSHGNAHSVCSLPVLLGGSLQGILKTGNYIDYRSWVRRAGNFKDEDSLGRVYNQLLVTILQGMGLQPADYEFDGRTGFGSYENWNKSSIAAYAPFTTITEKRAPLPFLTV